MSNWDDLAHDVENEIVKSGLDALHEEHAQGVADAAREAGLSTADDVVIEIEERGSGGDPRLTINVDRVRRRANQILSDGSPTGNRD